VRSRSGPQPRGGDPQTDHNEFLAVRISTLNHRSRLPGAQRSYPLRDNPLYAEQWLPKLVGDLRAAGGKHRGDNENRFRWPIQRNSGEFLVLTKLARTIARRSW
jgi:hypothetical protein